MVAIHLAAIGVVAAGLLASVFKVVQKEVAKHQQRRNSSSKDFLQNSPELSTLLTANIIINEKLYKFVKNSTQPFAHYDLAIDYCINHGE